MRVLLADDHTLVRAGIRSLLGDMNGVSVVAEAADGREAVRLALLHRPDIVMIDIAMPGMNGLEAAERIVRSDSHRKILVLSMHSAPEYVARAFAVGVHGYLLKEAAAAELEAALTAVASGERYVSPGLTAPSGSAAGSPLGSLTPRQREILQLIGEGKTTREIAAILRVSVKTADSHRTRLMGRLGIHDVAGLVRFAIRAGIVFLDRQ